MQNSTLALGATANVYPVQNVHRSHEERRSFTTKGHFLLFDSSDFFTLFKRRPQPSLWLPLCSKMYTGLTMLFHHERAYFLLFDSSDFFTLFERRPQPSLWLPLFSECTQVYRCSFTTKGRFFCPTHQTSSHSLNADLNPRSGCHRKFRLWSKCTRVSRGTTFPTTKGHFDSSDFFTLSYCSLQPSLWLPPRTSTPSNGREAPTHRTVSAEHPSR
jgi:hypothetical protein